MKIDLHLGAKARFRNGWEGTVIVDNLAGSFPIGLRVLRGPGDEGLLSVSRQGLFGLYGKESAFDVVAILP